MTDPFPNQLRDAAAKWRMMSTSFAQFRRDGEFIRLRMQAPETMTEFSGEVHFGRDPKGLLFYHAQSDFKVGEAEYRVYYHSEASPLITVRVEFYVPGETVVFARFLARVDTRKYTLPPSSSVLGTGKFRPFIAATCQTDIHKVTGSRRVRLRFPPIRRQTLFDAEGQAPAIDTTGVLIFPDEKNLKTIIEPNTKCVVDYAPDRFVFHPENNPGKVIALFLPAEPVGIDGTGVAPPPATWSDFNPDENNPNLEELQETA